MKGGVIMNRINPGTSGLAQNLLVRKSFFGKKLSVLKKVKTLICSQNEY